MKNLRISATAATLTLCASFLLSLTSCQKDELPTLSTINETTLSSNINASVEEEIIQARDIKGGNTTEPRLDRNIKEGNSTEPRLDRDIKGGNTNGQRLDRDIKGGNTTEPRLDKDIKGGNSTEPRLDKDIRSNENSANQRLD